MCGLGRYCVSEEAEGETIAGYGVWNSLNMCMYNTCTCSSILTACTYPHCNTCTVLPVAIGQGLAVIAGHHHALLPVVLTIVSTLETS